MSDTAIPEVVTGGEPAAAATPEISEQNTTPPAGGEEGGNSADLTSATNSSQEGAKGTEEPKTEEGADPDQSAAAPDDLTDDDPFAEFDGRVPQNKDKAYYEELFKTDKWRTVPHAARNEIIALTEKAEAAESTLNTVGGETMLATIKPVTAVLANPNPSNEDVEQAFDAINAHNPKVMESLGATFTENWVKEVLTNPAQNLGPLVQTVVRQTFQTNDYDLGRIFELIQLDLAVDQNGEKLLDTEYAREAFERQGGVSTFRYQRELAARDAELTKLKNGNYGQNPQAQTNDTSAKQPDFNQIDTDIEQAVMTEVTPVLDKIGKPGDPLYDIVSDAVRYRIRNAQEMQNIRNFAKSGAYKTPDGKFTQGVETNRGFLSNRVFAQALKELRAIQATRRGAAPAPATKQTKSTTSGNQSGAQNPGQNPGQPTGNTQQPATPAANAGPTKPKSVEDFAASTAKRVKDMVADEAAARQVASGK